MRTVQFSVLPFLTLATAALMAAAPPSGAAEAPKGTPEQRQTIGELRDVGTAMYEWYGDAIKEHGVKPAHQKGEPGTADMTTVPLISAQELAKILVPKYLKSVPEKDGWGHPLEYRLQTTDLGAAHIMALRSPGEDGRFAGDSYAIGPFAPTDLAQDVVWIDGYFARWPQANVKSTR